MSTISQWCRYCGVENRLGAKSCSLCGRPLGAADQREQVPQPQQENIFPQQNGSKTTWRSPRFFLMALLIICAVLAVFAGIGIYLIHHSQTGEYISKDITGRPGVHHLTTTPPSTITWTKYQNQLDGYTIDYPSNWLRTETSSAGHTGLALYPPGTNLNENVPGGPKGIGFTWVEASQLTVPTNSAITESKPITIDGITGHLYTQRSLGTVITVTFPLKDGGFIMTADATSVVLTSVFQHMLQSLKFN